MSAWDRQPGEPPKAYDHFTKYRDLGPGRSLAKVGELSGISAARAEQLSEQYGWVARCDQWDAHVQAIHDRALLTEAAKRGRQRAEAFTALLHTSLKALKSCKIEGNTISQVAAAMKVACEGMRLEEGLATAHMTMEVLDARSVLSRLPAEVRGPLLRALEEYAAPGGGEGAPLGLAALPAGGEDADTGGALGI